ncbi:hypothetical protein [Corticibacter populi]|uniref:hypothetical protein n=1 Tax=Corticibacter populi TaxID=1550736 RepID=UPI00102CDBC6|nr:hypothetical protein [Corticibacter populi]RZS35382.1 hypothetical protein EV687_0446 [Corticibacter populi]
MADQILVGTDICIKFNGKTFMTSTVKGKRASSNCLPSIAASRLGYKLFGDQYSHAQMCITPDNSPGCSFWTLYQWADVNYVNGQKS